MKSLGLKGMTRLTFKIYFVEVLNCWWFYDEVSLINMPKIFKHLNF